MTHTPGRFVGRGIELRPDHYPALLDTRPAIDWVEVISDRFLQRVEQRRTPALARVREVYPVALHGVGLSIGSVEPLDEQYLRRLKDLADLVEPVWVSDHLAWSSFGGWELDLLPLPLTEEALAHVIGRVGKVQDFLGRRLLLENPSSYLSFTDSALPEQEFMAAVACEADCGILLDVNNVYVSCRNHQLDPLEYLKALPPDRVLEIHLAGHHLAEGLWIDTHQGPVPEPVWELYAQALRLFGPVATIVEWDTGVPSLETLVAEVHAAGQRAEQVQAWT